MTTDHAAALDGAVRNLAGNVLTVRQILELISQWHDARVYADECPRDPNSSREADAAYSKMVEAITDNHRANVRPRP